MSDLSELYHDIILEHGKSPRNFREIENPTRTAEGYNPLCGDQIKVYLKLRDHTIDDASFTGNGCAICTAASSMMTDAVRHLSEQDADALFEWFHHLLTTDAEPGNGDGEGDDRKDLLAALAGVKRFPIRVKCATLPWHALHAALRGEDEPVTTE